MSMDFSEINIEMWFGQGGYVLGYFPKHLDREIIPSHVGALAWVPLDEAIGMEIA